ncbi:hypothetical protein K0M31_010927 [Melipona bicolor]|uniref:Cytochrome c oxidase assembly protein COX20, mitochondrial n=1 Tax=Melipona bicolor TaxID=60889 RepID=A0AA40FL76_9HYME|nr:hypothetical protein K0M31_010927 [Melipona bicolor]
METSGNKEQSTPFTFFGEPIIKTRCQRNAMISAISGGIICGLITFLFTSNPRVSTRMGVVGYGVIGITGACYCAYDEMKLRSEAREFRKAMYNTNMKLRNKDGTEHISNSKLESI